MKNAVNCVVMPAASCHIIVPNACVASMMSLTETSPADGYHEAVIGLIGWQGWSMPLLALQKLLANQPDEKLFTPQSRIAVLKSLGDLKHPYFGLLLDGFPRLTEIRENELTAGQNDLPETLVDGLFLGGLQLPDQQAILPDMDTFSRMVQPLENPI